MGHQKQYTYIVSEMYEMVMQPLQFLELCKSQRYLIILFYSVVLALNMIVSPILITSNHPGHRFLHSFIFDALLD